MRKYFINFLLIIFFLGVGTSYAQEGNDDDWEISLAPYLFLSSFNGNATVGPVSGSIDLSFSDLLKNLEIAGMLHADVRKGRFGLMTDVIYGKLAATTDLSQGANLSAEVEFLIFEAMGFYRLSNTRGKTDVFAGIRYWYFDVDTNFVLNMATLTNSATADWVDPVIGIRTNQPLSKKWFVILRADVGGFGISSDFSWHVEGGVGRKLGTTSSVFLGYKYLKTEYSNGVTGPGTFVFDSAVHGILLGFNFAFGPGAKK